MSDMEELKEKIARAMATESQYNFDHYADAALRAITEAGYLISPIEDRPLNLEEPRG